MKQITRRLYTKPVMLGMAFLMGLALVVGLFVTTKSTAMQSGFPVVAGNDEFETTANGESVHDFAGSPIPAGFFGTGSLAFAGTVTMEGVPLNPGVSDTDTIIQRHNTVSGPGGSTPLTMTALNLKGTAPITVNYQNGSTESWNVTVGLSQFKASTGTMTINSSSFDSTLKVWPRFTFTRNGVTKVLDTGGSGLAAASSTAAASAIDFNDGGVIVVDNPQPLPAPCKEVVSRSVDGFASATTSAAAASSCPPLTLTATSPWFPCPPTGFCKPPLTEAERWARHNASPPGTKKQQAGVAE
ncbi:MAG TPA: hypothetical protein VJT69_18360 [Pyrinomonadaceae bacterium]|nr:hypothetical protein [Pyrinomonadaceae bacterium]